MVHYPQDWFRIASACLIHKQDKKNKAHPIAGWNEGKGKDMRFKDRVVLVTGAAGGLGNAVVKKFTEEGARAAMLDCSAAMLEKAVATLGLAPEQYFCLTADITDEEAVRQAVHSVREHFGSIDVLVNLAGIPGPSARTEDYAFEDVKKVYAVNVFGTFLMMKYTLPVMQAQKRGVILNTGSVSGMFGYPYEIGYGSSKFAVIGMTKNAANENGGNGVRVNSVSPGWINTNMMKTVLDSYKDVGIENSSSNVTLGPFGRPATPAEVANVYAFLASDEAGYINGSNVLVDGGMTLG